MKKYFATLLCVVFFVTACLGFTRQSHEHQHRDTGRKQYEDREKRYQERMYWQMPLGVMDELGIGAGMSVADVGAGIGYFTLKLSKKVGKTGKVFASDIDKDALAFLDERRREAGLENIAIIHGRADDPLIPEESADLILIVNTIHLVKEKALFLNNIRKSLKEGGKVVFVQWDAEKMDPESPGWDPKDRELYTMHTMLNMIYDADYEVLEIKDFLPMQMIYICKPSDTTEQRIISNPVK
jgi:ubiquinone/menaquinone biosynthesis C-methylase UbiE